MFKTLWGWWSIGQSHEDHEDHAAGKKWSRAAGMPPPPPQMRDEFSKTKMQEKNPLARATYLTQTHILFPPFRSSTTHQQHAVNQPEVEQTTCKTGVMSLLHGAWGECTCDTLPGGSLGWEGAAPW